MRPSGSRRCTECSRHLMQEPHLRRKGVLGRRCGHERWRQEGARDPPCLPRPSKAWRTSGARHAREQPQPPHSFFHRSLACTISSCLLSGYREMYDHRYTCLLGGWGSHARVGPCPAESEIPARARHPSSSWPAQGKRCGVVSALSQVCKIARLMETHPDSDDVSSSPNSSDRPGTE